MITNGYTTLTMLKYRALTIQQGGGYATDAARDAIMLQEIDAASRWIDAKCMRKFYTSVETRYFSPRQGDSLTIDDLVSVTTLKTDVSGLRNYDTTWATTDYDLEPYNARNRTPAEPYRRIAVAPNGLNYFPTFARSTQIVGKWGYSDLTVQLSTLSAGINASVTTVPLTSDTDFAVGHIALVDDEQMFVDGVSGNNATVRRGVNGTTAASHLILAPVYVYDFGAIGEACAMQAHRLFARKAAILGVAGTTTLGQINMTVPQDRDIAELIASYKASPL